MGYDQNTLAQVSVLNVTPNGSEGAIWMAGSGPAADKNGNIYLLDANGVFDTALDAHGFPNQGDFGNAFLKISTSNKQLAVADYFEMSNQAAENGADQDLGSGGALVLPDLNDSTGKARHLAVGAGKDGNIYLVDRDAMGGFNPNSNNIYQQVSGAIAGVFSTPAYFNNTLYYGAAGGPGQSLCHQPGSAGDNSQFTHQPQVPVSGSHAEHLCQRHQHRDPMGGRK